MIEAGTDKQFEWSDGNWIFLDIGFSATKKTCGLVIGNEDAKCLDFAEAQDRIVQHVLQAKSLTNLMIEAPLSVCFRKGLPAARSIEKKDGQSRPWYVGAGCAVMVAAMYLIREVSKAAPDSRVRLFEAFISYKKRGEKSDHAAEAKMLRSVVCRERGSPPYKIISADQLKEGGEDQLTSAFGVMGLNYGVPAVVMITN
jgi:hypothetical protein